MKEYSERVPYKNLKDFLSKPLLFWILRTLQNSKYIDEIFVNTDSIKIKKIIYQYFGESINIIDRPKHLCGNCVSMNKIIKYDLGMIKKGEYFLQTHATNPLLSAQTIDAAIKKYFSLIKKGNDSLVSVTSYNSRFYTHKGAPINHSLDNLLRTQDICPIYEENSNIYIFSRKSFDKKDNRIGRKPFFYKINRFESVDIDYEEDFKFAELVYKFYHT